MGHSSFSTVRNSASGQAPVCVVAANMAERGEKFLQAKVPATLLLTGLVALLAAFRIATSGEAHGDEMFRDWMVDWFVIWSATAAFALWLLKPLMNYIAQDRQAYEEKRLLEHLSKISPSFAQELQSLGMHQQMRWDEAAEMAEALASDELRALSPLGGLRTEVSYKQANADSLEGAMQLNANFPAWRRSLMRAL